MKKVHSSKQLLHLFCNMTNGDLEGFRTSSSNIYFEDGVLWSYGRHYPMAAKYLIGEGVACHNVVLINSTKSSVTTQKHKSLLCRSLKPNQISFDVPNVREPKDPDNIKQLDAVLTSTIESVLSALRYSSYYDVKRELDERNMYAKLFGFKSLVINEAFLLDLEYISSQTEAKFKQREEQKQANLQAAIKAKALEYADDIKAWFLGENTRSIPAEYFNSFYNHDLIRIKDDKVETQRGATIKLDIALAAYKALQENRLASDAQIGAFQVESIDAKFIQIGCHKFKIEQLTEQLGRLV
jgi:hypothetical protein